MYTGLLHSHRLFVILFLLHYVIKLVLLLMNRHEHLARYTKTTKIPEIVLSVGFLLTGGGMLLKGAAITNLTIIKLIFVFASIPVAVIGFKRKNKALAFLSVALLIGAYGLAEMSKKSKAGKKIETSAVEDPMEKGKLIYSNTCVTCHGTDGKLGLSGAKDLSASPLTAEQQKEQIKNGKNSMPAYGNMYSEEEIDALVLYVGTLKQ